MNKELEKAWEEWDALSTHEWVKQFKERRAKNKTI